MIVKNSGGGFTIHTAKAGLSITGNTGAAVRTAAFVSKEATGGVLVPGTGNQISRFGTKTAQNPLQ